MTQSDMYLARKLEDELERERALIIDESPINNINKVFVRAHWKIFIQDRINILKGRFSNLPTYPEEIINMVKDLTGVSIPNDNITSSLPENDDSLTIISTDPINSQLVDNNVGVNTTQPEFVQGSSKDSLDKFAHKNRFSVLSDLIDDDGSSTHLDRFLEQEEERIAALKFSCFKAAILRSRGRKNYLVNL